ncbi:unnamed protein product [Cylindrotheca closterium]|uniref:Uncharacterized protein n=1 Tax=Cylindrotheca closterium TaxID=2856 RepID=A0AAD2FQE6_9STRA|nr:unnamed protein product [Cylindrotheca closterium]
MKDYHIVKDLCLWVLVFKERHPDLYDNLAGQLSKAASEPCCRVLYRAPSGLLPTMTLTFAKDHGMAADQCIAANGQD